eukprot:955671-Prorocentrum_lima.AAC.1
MSIDVLLPKYVYVIAISLGAQSTTSTLNRDSSFDAGGGIGNGSPCLHVPSNIDCFLEVNANHS